MSYTQLTREQRYQIYALKKAGHTQTATAALVGVHKSSVSRELRRNRGGRGYLPGLAHELSAARRRATHRPRITAQTWALIESRLRLEWSPEQVAGRLKLEGREAVSHERIYRHVYADRRAGGTLHLHLRCRRERRKRYGTYSRRGQIAGRVGIEARPRVVDARRRVGDWEADKQETVTDCVSWCTALLWIVPASVDGAWQTPDGTLTIAQKYQRFTGTLGSTAVTAGTIDGDRIEFDAGGVHYSGRVNGTAIDAVTSGGRTGPWTARRAHAD